MSKYALPCDPRSTRTLIVVLGDQLSPHIPSLLSGDKKSDVVLMAEVKTEASYVRHHKKKIAFIFSAMRHFADELRQSGWTVDYRVISETGPAGTFTSELERAIALHRPNRISVTSPGEWRVLTEISSWSDRFSIPVGILPDTRFICSTDDFAAWARGRKQLRMEYFYREMRRKTGLLMQGPDPEGGRWNFDRDNRRPAKADFFMTRPPRVAPDEITLDVIRTIAEMFPDNIGDLEPFWFAATRADAEVALEHFIAHSLPRFGDYQDAMLDGEPFLYHSVISPHINVGLLDPLDVCRRVEAAYRAGKAPLNAAEGFIRQIIGWREYVRGIYWLKMPGYANANTFTHDRPVPEFYWTARTSMACVRAAVGQTIKEAYSHHIQRLMVTGNFALLAGISPQALHEWYLAVYADAFEWVELPNTIGMSQFADGGLLASKPYVASGAYIARMSNYCAGCSYDVKDATGPKACPFNSLYWAFLLRHRDRLEQNPRMAQMYRTWERMDGDKRVAILKRAELVLTSLDDPTRGEPL